MSSLSWIWKNSNNIFFHCFNTISFDIWKFWIWLLIGWFRWKCLRLIYLIKFIFKWFQKVSFSPDVSQTIKNRYFGHFCHFDTTTLVQKYGAIVQISMNQTRSKLYKDLNRTSQFSRYGKLIPMGSTNWYKLIKIN